MTERAVTVKREIRKATLVRRGILLSDAEVDYANSEQGRRDFIEAAKWVFGLPSPNNVPDQE